MVGTRAAALEASGSKLPAPVSDRCDTSTMKPTYILGISAFYHDSAACLIRDGSIVAAATRDVRAVQRRLRHASASFTLDTYIHLLDDRAGVDAVANALRRGNTDSG